MYDFFQWDDPEGWQDWIKEEKEGPDPQSMLLDELEIGDWNQMMRQSLTMCQIPELPFMAPKSINPRKRKDRDQASSQAKGLITPIVTNIKTLWDIKRVHKKISSLMTGQQLQVRFWFSHELSSDLSILIDDDGGNPDHTTCEGDGLLEEPQACYLDLDHAFLEPDQ